MAAWQPGAWSGNDSSRLGSSVTVKLMSDKWLLRWHWLTQVLPLHTEVFNDASLPVTWGVIKRVPSHHV